MKTRMRPVTNYLKNVTDSVKYAAADIAKEDLMPNLIDFTSDNKEFLASTYATLKNPSVKIRRSVSAMQKSKAYQALDYGARNFFEDLKTGKFYNKEREDRDALRLGGLDFSDFDDLSEFGIDDDWEDQLNGKGKSSSSSKSDITAGDVKIVEAIEDSNASVASATVNAIITASEVESNYARANTSMLYIQNERLFGGLHKDLSAIQQTLSSMHKLTAQAFQNIDNNAASFFTAELKLSTERNAMLKEMLEMQRNFYKSAADKEKEKGAKSSRNKKRNRWRDVNIGGMPMLDSYFENIKDNLNEELSFMGISGFSEDANMLATYFTSPINLIMKPMIKGLIPAMVKEATNELDKTLSGVFGTLMGRLANHRDDYDLMGYISRIFGVKTTVNKRLDTSKYEKGPVPFDGITRKAIIDVIPSYLRRIEAHLTGRPEQAFDYEKGNWTNLNAAKAKFEKVHKDSVRRATKDLQDEMNSKLARVKDNFSQEADRESFDAAINEFYEYIYAHHGIFDPTKSADYNEISRTSYPNLRKHYGLFKEAFKDVGSRGPVLTRGGRVSRKKYSTKAQLANEIIDARDYEERMYRDMENYGTSLMSQYTSALGVDLHGKWDSKNKKFENTKNVLFTEDKLGNSVFDYLREINKELTWQRKTGFEDLFGMLHNFFNNASLGNNANQNTNQHI